MNEKETQVENSAAVIKPKAYKGTEPYLFISYSSKDKEEVYSIIEQLQRKGVRIWYDEGIKPPQIIWEKIASKINECHIYVALLTENFCSSKWCKAEFYHAHDKDKIISPIQLDEKTDLYNSKFPLAGRLMIKRQEYPNLDDFYHSILDSEGIEQCIDETIVTSVANPVKASQGKMPQVITNSVPTHPSVHFQGRETALQEIKALANKKIVLLNGIGGIGKTEICRHIFWDFYSNLTDDIEYLGWIFYESSLATSLFNKFDLIKEPDPERYQEAVRQMVNDCHFRKKLLLFVDNANELTAKEANWLNKLPCRMILTSRSKIESFPQYPIDTLLPDQCRSVYQQNSEDNDPESIPFIDEIIRLAAYHTQTVELLAKTQAASCMTAEELLYELNKHGFTLKDVLETVDSSHAGTSSNQRLIEHLAVIFDIAQIKDDEAIRILKLFSLLATNTPIEAKTLKDWLHISDLNAVNDLVRHGWLNKSGTMLSIHPVIAETVRYKCKPDYAFAEPLIKTLTDAINACWWEGVGLQQNALLPHCVSVAAILQGSETNDFTRFLDRIAMIMRETGDYTRALIWSQEAVRVAERINGTEHPVTATTYNTTGLIYQDIGDCNNALEYYNKALGIVENVLGTEHPDTATTYNNIALVSQAMGKYDMALEYHEKALTIRKKVLGTEHPDTAMSYNNIAFVYHAQGEFDRALKNYNKALAIIGKVLGTEHPYTAKTYNNIAGVYQDMGDYDKALEYFNIALTVKEKLLGEEHPDTAITYSNIARVYQEKGDYDKALEYFEKTIASLEIKYGGSHLYTATTYNNIAEVYYDKGDYDSALLFANKAEHIYEDIFGIKHPNTRRIYQHLAKIYKKSGDKKKAYEFRKKARK